MFWKRETHIDEIEILKSDYLILNEKFNSLHHEVANMLRSFNASVDILKNELSDMRRTIPTPIDTQKLIDEKVKKVGTYFHDQINQLDDSVGMRMVGLLKNVEYKIKVLLGDLDKTETINTLLKRIAVLEEIKYVSDKLRTPEQIADRCYSLQEQLAKMDREGKDDLLLKAQLDLMLWILGEDA